MECGNSRAGRMGLKDAAIAYGHRPVVAEWEALRSLSGKLREWLKPACGLKRSWPASRRDDVVTNSETKDEATHMTAWQVTDSSAT